MLAVDPSSPFSGGAILGDRVRMQDHATDPGFIRSMATRGHLGGLALATPEAIRLLGALGWRWILVETVGVGQVEVEIAGKADTTIVVVNPGWGDSVQAAKAGLMEVADLFVINKADRPGVDDTRRDLQQMLDLTSETAGRRRIGGRCRSCRPWRRRGRGWPPCGRRCCAIRRSPPLAACSTAPPGPARRGAPGDHRQRRPAAHTRAVTGDRWDELTAQVLDRRPRPLGGRRRQLAALVPSRNRLTMVSRRTERIEGDGGARVGQEYGYVCS